MNPATVLSRAQFGLDAPLVRVEVHCGGGLPQLTVVGLAEVAVRESRERVRAAIVKDGADFPPGRITVSLAPADLPKEGGRFDLPIALGILAAAGRLPGERLAGTGLFASTPLRQRVSSLLCLSRTRRLESKGTSGRASGAWRCDTAKRWAVVGTLAAKRGARADGGQHPEAAVRYLGGALVTATR